MKNLYILLLLSLSFGTVTDIDGNVYETVQIGEQLWMAENLKVTHYNNGDELPNPDSYSDISYGAYAIYNNDESIAEIYGYHYNWYAVVDSRGLCPNGWHVPTDEEWKQLEIYLGMCEGSIGDENSCADFNAGIRGCSNNRCYRGTDEVAKLAGSPELWSDNQGGGLINNPEFGSSGFDALPAGIINWNGSSDQLGEAANFNTVSEYNSDRNWDRQIGFHGWGVYRDNNFKKTPISVRCIENDATTGCTDPEACNYDETANVDDGSCEYEVDCAGTCGGDLEWDCAGICGGDNSSYDGCCGLPPNDDCTDDCVIDDLGQCCTPQDVDGCGICFGDGTDCECSGDLEVDCCGVCGGDNSSCSNCCGMPFPDDCSETCYEDNCGVCDDIPENDCVQDCAGTWGGDAVIDECDVCGGDNTSCQQLGDLNGDGTINVIDIVMAVDLILNDNYDVVGDVNEDGQLNVIDIVILVDWVLNGMPEADSDGDGVLDEDDSDPNNPYQCSDLDGDTCDDCSTGTFNPSDDGYDYDGDGQCDDGDCDDDNDGCQECWDYCY